MRTLLTLLILSLGTTAGADTVRYESRDPAYQTWVNELHLAYLWCEATDEGFAITVELLGEDASIIDETTREGERIYYQKRWWTEAEIEDHIKEHGCPSDATS